MIFGPGRHTSMMVFVLISKRRSADEYPVSHKQRFCLALTKSKRGLSGANLSDAPRADDVEHLAQQGPVLQGIPEVLVGTGRNHHPREILDPLGSRMPPLLGLLRPGLCATP